jgi:hypothetical protein
MSGVSTATVLAAASIASTVAATGMQVMSQAQQAQSQSAMYGYQAAVARNNQQQANAMAVDAEQRGRVEEQRQRTKTASLIGTQQANLAAQGTDLSGSSADIMGDTAAVGELDALTIRSNAAREAWGYRAKGVEYGNAVSLANAQQGNSGLSALGVGSSLIAGAGSVADKWYRFDKAGAFGGSGKGSDLLSGTGATY